MKYEPLKGKVRFLRIEGTNENIVLGSPFVYLHDVKSAVQGLLQEIDSSYGCVHHREEGGNDDCIICVTIGQTLNEVKRKIKKWFPDVVEE